MIQFYAPDIHARPFLGPEESSHCIRVLRKKVGDDVCVTDGKGNRYECKIISADSRKVCLQIINVEEVRRGWDFRLTLVVAPTKNSDRMEWLVEKATEIGVDEIRFIRCSHSERKNINLARLHRIAISAINQSLKCHLPVITGMDPIKDIYKLKGEKYFGYCDENHPRMEFVKTFQKDQDTIIAIGPEGDFSPEEVDQLSLSGYKAVNFGQERLRTETAALYALTAAHIINEMKI